MVSRQLTATNVRRRVTFPPVNVTLMVFSPLIRLGFPDISFTSRPLFTDANKANV